MIEKLIEALRSGDYKQGRLSLRDTDDKFCCLGVACDVFRKETGVGEWEKDFRGGDTYRFNASGSISGVGLPRRVQEYFGFKNLEGWIEHKSISLMYMNDWERLTFEEIANILEEEE